MRHSEMHPSDAGVSNFECIHAHRLEVTEALRNWRNAAALRPPRTLCRRHSSQPSMSGCVDNFLLR